MRRLGPPARALPGGGSGRRPRGARGTHAGLPHIVEFDVMRGAAILWVLYLHAVFGAWPGTPGRELVLMHATSLVGETAVPSFLFMSGFLMARDGAPDARTYTRRRVRRVVLPMACCMTAILAFDVARRGGIDARLARSFVAFDVSGQYYYLPVLVVLTAVAYPLRHAAVHRLRLAAFAAFVVNLVTIGEYEVHGLGGLARTELAYRNPLAWVFFLLFGLYVARARGRPAWDRRTAVAAGVAMLALFVGYVADGEITGRYPDSYFGVVVFLFGALSLIVYPSLVRLLIERRVTGAALAPLRALGPYAFAIYLVHKPVFTDDLANAVVSRSALATDYLLRVAARLATGGAATVAFVAIAGRLGGAPARTMLGIDRRAPAPPGIPRRQRRAAASFRVDGGSVPRRVR